MEVLTGERLMLLLYFLSQVVKSWVTQIFNNYKVNWVFMFLFRLYLSWMLSWSILLMLLRYVQFLSLLPFSPNMVWSCFCHFSLTACCSVLAECLWSATSGWYWLRCASVSISVNHSPHQGNANSGYWLPHPCYAQLLLYHPGWLNVPSLAICTTCPWWI